MRGDRILRLAAASMREQYLPGRGFTDDTFLAVADWLTWQADLKCEWDTVGGSHALAVADAYLSGAA